MLSSYHPFTVIAGWFNPGPPSPALPSGTSGQSTLSRTAERRLPPYYLPGFEPGKEGPAQPESSLPEMIEEIVEAARLGLESVDGGSNQVAPLAAEKTPVAVDRPALPEPIVLPEGERLASETVELLQCLRRGEWQTRASYEASLHVLSYQIFSDSSGELLARTSRLVSDLEAEGLVKLVDSDSSLSGFTCVKLRSKGRMLADRTLSPVSYEA